MRIHKTSNKNRTTYRYTFKAPVNIDGKMQTGFTIKPGENGVTEALIKILHAEDDREVYNNLKNIRPNRTTKEKAEIKAWKENYVKRFKVEHGYEPGGEDVDAEAEEHFPRNYNLSLDFDADGELEVDKSHLAEALSTTDDHGFEWSEEMKHALSTLTDKQRQVINRMFVEKHTQSEIARRLGISSAGVKKHYDIAIKNLKAVLLGKK